jgi:Na+/proline symporter
MAMAAFAVLFGTRTVDTSEHQDGLMLAVATESVVKLVAFLIVGCFVTFVMFDGFGDLFTGGAGWCAGCRHRLDQWRHLHRHDAAVGRLQSSSCRASSTFWWSRTIIRLSSTGRAGCFPAYLLAINVFVVPIALAGQVLLGGQVEPDTYVLQLPMSVDAGLSR